MERRLGILATLTGLTLLGACESETANGGAGGAAGSASASSASKTGASSSSSKAASSSDASSASASEAASSTASSGGAGGEAATASSSASTGIPSFCVPGETRACYTGPVQTRGVGTCTDGAETCAPDGESFGPCSGDIVPTIEDCSTPEFESCTPNACTSWSQRWPAATPAIRLGARGGRVTITLGVPIAFELGNGVSIPATPIGSTIVQAIGLDADLGLADWAAPWESRINFPTAPATGPILNLEVEVDSQGRTFFGGYFTYILSYGGTIRATRDGLDLTEGVLASVDGAGNFIAGSFFGGRDWDDDGRDGWDKLIDIAVTGNDSVWRSSIFNSEFNGLSPGSALYFSHALVGGAVPLGSGRPPDNMTLWRDEIVANATNTAGALVAVGSGPGCFVAAAPPNDFLVRMDAGTAACTVPPVSIGARAVDVALDDLDRAYVLGRAPSVLAMYDSGLAQVWSIAPPYEGRLAVGPSGELYLYGTSNAGILTLTELDATGAIVATRTFGAGTAGDIAVDETGAIYLAGNATGDVDFGIGVMTGTATDVFVAKIQP